MCEVVHDCHCDGPLIPRDPPAPPNLLEWPPLWVLYASLSGATGEKAAGATTTSERPVQSK